MKFRWLGNSCIEIIGKTHLLIDPNYLVEPQQDIDYILVTHEHKDHFDKDKVMKLNKKIIAPKATIEEYQLENAIQVTAGDKIDDIEVVDITCYGAKEAVGYLIHDKLKLLHTGDCFSIPEIDADIMFVPIFKEYHNEIIHSIKKCNPQYVFPLHFKLEEKKDIALILIEKIHKINIKSKLMELGSWNEF